MISALQNMKLKFLLPTVALIAFFAGAVFYQAFSQDSTGKKVLYYTCPMHPSVKSDKPGSCPMCGMTLEAVYADDKGTNNVTTNSLPHSLTGATNNASADSAKTPTPYPLTTCVVDGMKLGSMGPPYVFVYQGQEVKFCCANCKPRFDGNPDQYMKIIKDAEKKK